MTFYVACPDCHTSVPVEERKEIATLRAQLEEARKEFREADSKQYQATTERNIALKERDTAIAERDQLGHDLALAGISSASCAGCGHVGPSYLLLAGSVLEPYHAKCAGEKIVQLEADAKRMRDALALIGSKTILWVRGEHQKLLREIQEIASAALSPDKPDTRTEKEA